MTNNKRHISDYYVTPKETINTFFNALKSDGFLNSLILNSENILDPCAGGDSKHDMRYPTVLQTFGYNKKIDTLVRAFR